MTYNIAIIGGGLAGLSLSIDLREKGYDVIVIEKGNYPRHKVCGEYISMESHSYVQAICPALSGLDLPVINKFGLSSTGKNQFNTALDLGGFGISRYLLEKMLFDKACSVGVIFMTDTKATNVFFEPDTGACKIETTHGDVCALLACNASGRKSNFETKEKANRPVGTNYVGVKYHIKITRDPTLIEIHNFPGGYCGISNIEDSKSCLCYIVNSKQLNSVQNSIPELEKQFLYKNNNLRILFNEAEFLFKKPVIISGINFRIKEPYKGDLFSLGDAVGSIAPITGNGMSNALRSASTLAQMADNYFSKQVTYRQLIDNYTHFWNKEFSKRIKISRDFQKLSEYPLLTNLSIGILNTFPYLAKSIIRQTHGERF